MKMKLHERIVSFKDCTIFRLFHSLVYIVECYKLFIPKKKNNRIFIYIHISIYKYVNNNQNKDEVSLQHKE